MADNKSGKMGYRMTAHTFTEHTASMAELSNAYTVLNGNQKQMNTKSCCKWRTYRNRVGQCEPRTGLSRCPVNKVMNLQIVRGLLWVHFIEMSTS